MGWKQKGGRALVPEELGSGKCDAGIPAEESTLVMGFREANSLQEQGRDSVIELSICPEKGWMPIGSLEH